MAAEGDSIDGLLSESSELELEQLFPEIAAFADALTRPDHKGEEISPEDAAWVDSCLTGDPALTEDGWSALREALFDTLTDRIAALDDTPISANHVADEVMSEEKYDDGLQVVCSKEHFSFDGQEEGGDTGSDAVASGDEAEALEDIFRVWDIHTPDEEDELIKQLKKALDDPSAALDEKQLDELVTGIADLKPFFSD